MRLPCSLPHLAVLALVGSSPWSSGCSSVGKRKRQATVVRLMEYKWPIRDYSKFCTSKLHGKALGSPWTATVLVPKGAQAKAVIWYFHGGFGSPDIRSAISGKGFWNGWQYLGDAKPTVVALTLGPTWLANADKLELARQARRQIMDYLHLHHSRQLLLGVSMGGFNGLQLLIAEQGGPRAFDRAVLVSPGFSLCPPYLQDGSAMTFEDCARGNHVDCHTRGKYLDEWLELTREHFPNRESWTRFAPAERAKQLQSPGNLLILAGERDQFGFDEGAEVFAETSGCHLMVNPKQKHKLAWLSGARIGEFLREPINGIPTE